MFESPLSLYHVGRCKRVELDLVWRRSEEHRNAINLRLQSEKCTYLASGVM